MTEQQPAPSSWEFRLSPDRLDFAVYDPDKGRWFVPNAPMRGQWVDSADMDRMGWTRYESAAAPSAPADRGALYRELADEAAEWGGVITEQELRRKARQATAAVLPPPDSQTAEIERLRKEHATWRKLGQRNLERAHEENARIRAVVERVRRLHDGLDAETDLASPDDEITRGAAARKIAAALDGYMPPAAPPVPSAPVDRAALLRAADFFRGLRLTGTAITTADAEAELRRMADEAQQPETQADDEPPAPLRRSWDDCPGFPEQCPNILPVDPDPPIHYGGIRCGCADQPAVGAQQPKEA